MLAPGERAWGARLRPNSEDYFQFTIGPRMGNVGGTGAVHQLMPRSKPPLVGKLYKDDIIKRIGLDKPFAQRIFALALHRDELSHAMPFATWPRRILFKQKDPSDPQHAVIGFTMERLIGTTSLYDLITQKQARLKVTPSVTAYLCITLADQLARMHRHPWKFVFGDLSPNNIHVSANLTRIHFIDTDGFQFEYNNGLYPFNLAGLTASFKSPTADAIVAAKGRLTPIHDDYVLAILIFMMVMADKGQPAHPFQCGDTPEDKHIERRFFPLATPQSAALPRVVIDAYLSLPDTLRDTFTRTFTSPVPVPAAEWVPILSDYRRSL